MGPRKLRDLLRGSFAQDAAARAAAFGAEVDEPVGGADDVEVVLDQEDGASIVNQALEAVEELADIVKVQAGGGFVEDKQRPFGGRLGQVGGQFDPLCFAARKGGGGLAQAEIAEAYVGENLETLLEFGRIREEAEPFGDGEAEHLMDIESLVLDVEDRLLETGAAALFADEFDVGEELHFDGDGAVALADFAAAAGDVEGEVAGGVAFAVAIGRGGEQVADDVEGLDVGDGIRTRGAADGGLVDEDDFVEQVGAIDGLPELAVGAGELFALLLGGFPRAFPFEFLGQSLEDDLMDQGAFTGAGDAGDGHQHIKRDGDVDVLEVIGAGAADGDDLAGVDETPGDFGRGFHLAVEVLTREGLAAIGEELREVAFKDHLPPMLPGSGAEVDDVVGGAHDVGIVLDDEDGIAEVAQLMEDFDEAGGVAGVEADGRFVEDVAGAHEPGAETGGELDALGFAAGEGGGQAV